MLFTSKLEPKRCESNESIEMMTNPTNVFSLESLRDIDVENEGHLSTRLFKNFERLGKDSHSNFQKFFNDKI